MSITLHAALSDAGKRLDSFLHERLPHYSRSRLQSWIKDNRALVDGAPVRSSHTLRGGERIDVSPADLPPLKAEPEALPLKILYEDADVIVIDKPAGMVVHAGAGHHQGTLVNALLHHFGQLSSVGGDLRPGIVHRLDRETSGVLVVARTDQAHQSLAAPVPVQEGSEAIHCVSAWRYDKFTRHHQDSDSARSCSAHAHDHAARNRANALGRSTRYRNNSPISAC